METVHESPEFEEWMALLNADLNKLGMDVRELAQLPYREWFDSDISAAEAAKRAMRDSDEVGEILLFDELDDVND